MALNVNRRLCFDKKLIPCFFYCCQVKTFSYGFRKAGPLCETHFAACSVFCIEVYLRHTPCALIRIIDLCRCVKAGVSRSYRKLIRLRWMEDNGHYHCFFNELCYCPLSSFDFRRSLTSDNFSFLTTPFSYRFHADGKGSPFVCRLRGRPPFLLPTRFYPIRRLR